MLWFFLNVDIQSGTPKGSKSPKASKSPKKSSKKTGRRRRDIASPAPHNINKRDIFGDAMNLAGDVMGAGAAVVGGAAELAGGAVEGRFTILMNYFFVHS